MLTDVQSYYYDCKSGSCQKFVTAQPLRRPVWRQRWNATAKSQEVQVIYISWSPGGATTQTITGLAAGAYVITITDTVTLCTVRLQQQLMNQMNYHQELLFQTYYVLEAKPDL